MTDGCPIGALKYEFDKDGHTIARCGALDRYWGDEIIHKDGRRLCPHYGGKCPGLIPPREQIEARSRAACE